MLANKVVFAASVLIDLTQDTVSPEALLGGTTAHDKTGTPITGTLEVRTIYAGADEPDASLGKDGDLYLVTG